jgi:hypothetical protein
MKPGKAKSEIIILGAVILALLLYLVLRNPDRMNYRLPGLPSMNRADISRIDISRAGRTIRLEKKDNLWVIQPQGFLSDPVKINAIVDVIANLLLTALVSESGNYAPYGLDKENEIAVKAYAHERLLREFSVGNAAATYNHTFVKLADDPRVFHARNSFRGDLDQKVDGLRDKTVLQFDKNEISAIEIDGAGEKNLFTKNVKPVEIRTGENEPTSQAAPQGEGSWLSADGKPGNGSELNSIIEQASRLACEGFIEGKSRDDFKDPIYTVLLKGRKDYRLAIYPKAEKEISYAAVSSETPYPFLLSAYKVDGIMKKPETLKKEKPAGK